MNWRVSFLRALFLLVLCAVLALALLPSPESLPVQTGWDKMDHVLAFFVLGLLGLSAWPAGRTWVVSGLLAYGGLIEILQSLTAFRDADWNDFVADAIGLAFALLLVSSAGGRLFRR